MYLSFSLIDVAIKKKTVIDSWYLLCFSILYSYQIPEFVKLKRIISTILPSYGNILCRVISPYLIGIYFTEHISSQRPSSINYCCSSMFIWYHLGVPPSMRFFSRANKQKVYSCLGEHLVTFGCTTGIREKPRNTNHRNDNSPWVSEEVIGPKVNFPSGWVLVVLIS